MRQRAAVLAAAAAAAAAAAPTTSSNAAPPPVGTRSFCDEPGWTTTFVDEFDGAELNASNWQIDLHRGS